jgi:selenophosphate synthetase-related protein
LDEVVAVVRNHPAMGQKAAIGLVREVFGAGDWFAGPGDDGAVVQVNGSQLVVCGEALFPPFVAHDPFGAGIAAVLTNVNDLAAMGAAPLAIVDTVVGDTEQCRTALEGMRYASGLYDVPIVGGHLTILPGAPAMSAFGLGVAPVPLTANAARPGHRLALLACLEGAMRDDFPFFRSFDERGSRLAGDVRLLSQLAADGSCAAAKDVSMAGLVGSLAMLLEPTGCGVTLDLATLPCPAGVDLERWLVCFPCFAFLLCVPDGRLGDCGRAAAERGLTCTELGVLDDSGQVRLRDGDVGSEEVVAIDLAVDTITGLRATDSVSAG